MKLIVWIIGQTTVWIKLLSPLIYLLCFLYTLQTYKEIEREKMFSNERIADYNKTGAWG